MNEVALIQKYLSPLTRGFKESLFLEDDAAFLKKNNKIKVLSVDNFIHGVHCPIDLSPNLSIARSIMVAASDLAAMAASPYCMLISISLPNKNNIKNIKKIVKGIKWSIKKTKLKLLGGDLCSYNGPLSFCVTVIGTAKNNYLLKRKGAKSGDYLMVTGNIGDSKIGLDCLEKKINNISVADKKKAIKRFLIPPLRHELAVSLSPHVKSCIDISDGLVIDAGKLAKSSECGLKIESSKTPLSNLAKRILKKNYCSIEELLSAGDDYELAFAVDKANIEKIKKIALSRKTKVSIIGKFTKNKGTFLDDKKFINGYSHFK